MPRTSPNSPAELKAVAHLEQLLDGTPPRGRQHWHHVLGALDVVTATPSPKHTALLRRIATFDGTISVNARHGLPHTMPPEEMLRAIAVQTLGRWDRHRHASVIRAVARDAEHDTVARLAEAALQR